MSTFIVGAVCLVAGACLGLLTAALCFAARGRE